MIVLNSRKAVHELIDKRSAIYSGRSQAEQFVTALKGENIGNLDTDAAWRAQRKITVRFFAPVKLDGELAKISEAEYVYFSLRHKVSFQDLFVTAAALTFWCRATTLLHDLLVTPQDYSKHIDRSTASFSAIALYGQRAKTIDDSWATVRQSSNRTGMMH